MAVVQSTHTSLTRQLRSVRGFDSYIFFLRLINLPVCITDSSIGAGFYRAKGHRSFYMGVLRFNLLFKFQMLCGFASIGIRNSFHPQLFPGGQTLFSLCKFFLDPLGFSPCMGQFFIRCLRRELVSGKLQLGSLFRILR